MRFVFILASGIYITLFLTTDVTAQSGTGELTGRVELAASRISATSGPQGRYRRQTPPSESRPAQRPVLISLESTSNFTRPTPTEIQKLDQTGLQFEPRLMGVVVGEKVRVVNSDPVYHNVFSLSSIKRFDIGRRPRGEHVDVIFDQTGIVQVFCDIHPHMTATIVVLPENTFNWYILEENTEFNLNNIPEGTYRISIMSPGFQEYTDQIRIQRGIKTSIGSITLEAS
jgi:plastocyanin